MISQSELKQLLSSKFDFDVWKPILEQMFLKIDYLTKEIQIDASLVKSGGQIGTIRLDDGRSLGLFKFEVADNIIIARNRKGLREIAAKYVDQDIIHGALVFYYSTQQPDYRLTFVSKQTVINANGEWEKKETAPKRYTFLLGENEPCTTAASRLHELISKSSVYLADVTDAFSVERLNKEFFKAYKEQYQKFLKYLNADTKANRDYVKKLLGRLVFLHFLQKKGWMGVPMSNSKWEGGDKAYLLHLVEHNKGNNRLLTEVLEKLFFKTINEKRTDDKADPLLGDNIKIPYLNGGLFDEDSLDKQNIDFPYAYFKDLMEFFAWYNFTIDENDPDDSEIGIDPEMLGHIFENLLEDNKDKGAFYTPKEIVQYMSRESVCQYLRTCTPEDLHAAIDTLVKQKQVEPLLQNRENARLVNRALETVKVCDPAIGSGAFPMGVLNVLFDCRHLLYGFIGENKPFSYADIKKQIIQNNIYGVDIEQGAVDIARLRFWLALVVDENEPQPLPNLDYKIMCGDSLLHRFVLDAPFQDVLKDYNRENNTNYTLDNYRQWVYDYTNISDHTQKDDFRNRIEEIKHAFKTELSKKEKTKIAKVRAAIANLQMEDLFGTNPKDKEKELKKLQKQLKTLEQQRDEIISNKIYEHAFEWRFEFPDLLDSEGNFTGFDIVIGNPPYLRVQGIKNQKPLYADELVKKYKAATGSYDLYAIFAERGLQIINETGIVNYIMPVKWTNAAFGKGLRSVISAKRAAYKIINFSEYQVFDASTYTGLQWFVPNTPQLLYYELNRNLSSNQELKIYLESLTEESATKIDAENLHSEQWTLTAGKAAAILSEMEKQPRRIKDVFDKIFQGIATSKDDVYFLYNCKIEGDYIIGESKQLVQYVKIEKGLVKPLLKGEDVHRYDKIRTDKFVIFPYKVIEGKIVLYTEKELQNTFPLGYVYLKENEKLLRGREKGRFNIEGAWYQYGRKQGISMAEKEKLIAPDISLGGNFAYDKEGIFYQTTTIYGYIKKKEINESYKFWMALLNSRLCWWFLTNTGTTLANGFFRYKPDYINPFPVPGNIPFATELAVTILVDYILTIKSLPEGMDIDKYVNNDVIIRQFELIIDALIYELYFPEQFNKANIAFAPYVVKDFAEINVDNISTKIEIIARSFAKFRDIDNMVRNNLKYMSVNLEDELAPITNQKI